MKTLTKEEQKAVLKKMMLEGQVQVPQDRLACYLIDSGRIVVLAEPASGQDV
jgi:hypothetical protein